MNQITNIVNTASTLAAMSYAKKLAAEGKTAAQIGIMVRAAGYRLADGDATAVWRAYQEHNAAFLKALEVGQ
jgi:uncharacterized membrane protein